MFKKAGMVTVGVTAGLLVAAPFASAGEAHDHDGDHHHKKKHGHESSESSDCNVTGGSSEANGGIDGDALLGNALTQLPVGGANIGNIVCNDILNDNLSGNSVALDLL